MSKTPRPAGSPPQAGPRTHGSAVLPRDIKVMLVAAFLIALGFGLVAPVLPQFATTFDVGATAAAVIVSIFAFMRLVFAPAGGALIVRLGERPVYVAGLLIVAASTAACAFAQDYWQLLIFRGLGGAGSVMFTVASMALVVRLAPPESRGRVSGAYASAFLIGNVCGPVVGGLLAGFGLRVPFLVYAAALVLAAVVVQTQLSHVPAASRPDGSYGAGNGAARGAARQRVPGGAVLQLRERLGDLRRADGHGAALRGRRAERGTGIGGLGPGHVRRGQCGGADVLRQTRGQPGPEAHDDFRSSGDGNRHGERSASRTICSGSWWRPLSPASVQGCSVRPSRQPWPT